MLTIHGDFFALTDICTRNSASAGRHTVDGAQEEVEEEASGEEEAHREA